MDRGPLTEELYHSVRTICDWRLGRRPLLSPEGSPPDVSVQPLTLDELIACLKRLRKSIRLWTQAGGRQGYLIYISQFL